jgi:hypothetical protein
MVRFNLWFVVFELELRRSLRILWNKKARRVLLGVEVRIGKKHFSRLPRCQLSVYFA